MTDSAVEAVRWDLEPLLRDVDAGSPAELLDRAESMADELSSARGKIATMTAGELSGLFHALADLSEVAGRAAHYAQLSFTVDTLDPALGAQMQMVEQRSTDIATKLLFIELEWAALDDDHAERLRTDPELAWCSHHLFKLRQDRPHLLSEPEERIMAEKAMTASSAWSRLFDELIAAIEVKLPDGDGTRTVGLEQTLSLLASPDRELRRSTAEAFTAGLAPGLKTRAFIYNTLLQDKSTNDKIRSYSTWISSRNLENEATDESVQALVEAVQGRYDIARRWYSLKSKILGYPLKDYDRMASVAESDVKIDWDEACSIVLDAYGSFSPELADLAKRFFDEQWIDAPTSQGKMAGAFCDYTVPSHHPYVLLNWTGRRNDVLTLAHELGHGLHGYLSRPQGIFEQSTPLTLCETASVFGEQCTFQRLLNETSQPNERLALLAESIEGGIATVFRQTTMNRFENEVHEAYRSEGELSVERFGELWGQTQSELLGDAVEVTEGYKSWWSYVPHFISVPGYVYAYSYGQLLAMSVYKRYETQGSDFVSRYVHLLSSGGSMPPEELAQIVGCDLNDPEFWDQGLSLIQDQVDAAEIAAIEAGRISVDD
ncbi:MAG: M3 family oligoendopeptidase [Acidimicrobiales bacterium]